MNFIDDYWVASNYAIQCTEPKTHHPLHLNILYNLFVSICNQVPPLYYEIKPNVEA